MSENNKLQTYHPKPLIFTSAAAAKVWELVCEEENPELKLRVFVTGGGCSGLQYGFTFDEVQQEDDTVIEKQVEDEDEDGGEGGDAGHVQLLIDPMSLQYLTGAEIDYTEDVQGAQFVIRNPNAKTTCGCGSSFSV
jgi:iron-sulfur cluster insertion protein